MTILTIIGGWLLMSLLVVMLPFWVIGWLFAGWRPFLTTLILWASAVFVFHLWSFGWLYLPFPGVRRIRSWWHSSDWKEPRRSQRSSCCERR
jgi:hypothetical protein